MTTPQTNDPQTPDHRPLLAITLGDPSGVGPEITLRALAEPEVYTWCRPVVIGDIRILERAAAAVDSTPTFQRIEHLECCYMRSWHNRRARSA